MIYSLNGTLLEKSTDLAVIECGGVGYAFSCSNNTLSMLPAAGENAFVYTVLSVKENGVDLYGFSTPKERDAFKLLCSISGVGPKLALSVLSTYDADRLALLIASGDAKAVTACPGVGPRLAQRIVNELKDKVLQLDVTGIGEVVTAVDSSAASEAVAALISLGFSHSEAASAVAGLPPELSTEDMITSALRSLSTR
ncbi:MAG: Holliday junction branch migration protein RuvA [Oscillospiraceae bacterium]|nr:Holliday junction branch migration protein RuvA [Oscillospiraceae bacterium]MBR4928158.1 Holliday junction branch migration protein RuvA [Oscillospiraceae bacterium]MBR5045763.1 Holliday junction branch migration protein RuvA [Oscillospiraceae bacterium]MBR5071108.1 Holliday junction branch migration protein RuvA [Oscillospiraceae bacterium]